MRKRVFCVTMCIAMMLFLGAPPVMAQEPGPVEVHTVEDLLAIAEDPAGSYILMEDLDLTGVDWKPLDFSGSFDGNGHAILNLTISQTGEQTVLTYDGNRKSYETAVAGMFATMQDAAVTNLKLLNVRALMDVDTPGFLGGIAGYAENTAITDCTVSGCLELRAHDRMFGLGGVVGYGSGSVEGCQVDVTLVCVDTDAETSDEQFLGGVYAAGFMDVKDCEIIIDGYVSEHGYAHNGGIVGMYAEYPLGEGQSGYINGNSVKGKITFFEDSAKRRAYCEPYVGEAMVNRYYLDRNTQDFQRDERSDYSTELRPEMCAAPTYSKTLVAAGCESYGYTIYRCDGCGYCYSDHYTLFEHAVSNWTVIQEATLTQEGLREGLCDSCGAACRRVDPVLAPEPSTDTAPAGTEAPEQREEHPEAQPAKQPAQEDKLLPVLIGVDIALAVIAVLIIRKLARPRKRKGKYHR